MKESCVIRVCNKFGTAIKKFAEERRWTTPVATDELSKDITLLIPYLIKEEKAS